MNTSAFSRPSASVMILTFFVLLAISSSLASPPSGFDFTVPQDAPYEPGKLLVRFTQKPDHSYPSTAQRDDILRSAGNAAVIHDFKIVPGLSLVELPADQNVARALNIFNGATGILYAQPNYEVRGVSAIPDDTMFSQQWGMFVIRAPRAWEIATDSNVVVAVIDSGIDYNHPDLAANMWVNEAEQNGSPGVDDDENGYVDDIYGYDFCMLEQPRDSDPIDDLYHGTHCAGIAGAAANNSAGVAGLCWSVKIMSVKCLNYENRGYTSDTIDAIGYALDMGAKILSNSWMIDSVQYRFGGNY